MLWQTCMLLHRGGKSLVLIREVKTSSIFFYYCAAITMRPPRVCSCGSFGGRGGRCSVSLWLEEEAPLLEVVTLAEVMTSEIEKL